MKAAVHGYFISIMKHENQGAANGNENQQLGNQQSPVIGSQDLGCLGRIQASGYGKFVNLVLPQVIIKDAEKGHKARG